jgi:hypothetical protein
MEAGNKPNPTWIKDKEKSETPEEIPPVFSGSVS